MKKKSLTIVLVFIIVLTMFPVPSPKAYASSQELQQNLSDVEDAQDETSKKLSQVEKDIKELQTKVDALNVKINKTAGEISDTEADIVKKQEEMQTQETNLNKRLRVMYKNGSVGFVDVLLGSSSITEFVSNLEIIQKIYKNDVEVLETLKKEHEELEKIKAGLEKKKQELASQKTEMAAEKKKLDEKKSELEAKEDELKAEADRLTKEIIALMDTSTEYVGGVFTWPCPSSHYITSSFGNRLHPILKVWKFHTGIDVGASSGNNILAAASGKVIMSRVYGGYGKCIMIDHGGGIVTLYGHCSQLLVSEGTAVTKGQVIGLIGSTGNSTGPHLHFEVREDGAYVNPMNYFN